MLTSLTPSKLVSSTTDLAAHLLTIMQVQRPQPAGTPALPIGDPPSWAYLTLQERTIPRVRQLTVSTAIC